MKSKRKFNVQSFENHAQSIFILLTLEKEGELNFQSFINVYSVSTNTMYRTLDALKEMKLVNTKLDNARYPPQNMISLSDKGKKVAKLLKEIEGVLED